MNEKYRSTDCHIGTDAKLIGLFDSPDDRIWQQRYADVYDVPMRGAGTRNTFDRCERRGFIEPFAAFSAKTGRPVKAYRLTDKGRRYWPTCRLLVAEAVGLSIDKSAPVEMLIHNYGLRVVSSEQKQPTAA